MKKNIVYYLLICMSITFLPAQELFLQETDKVKGSKRVKGKDYVTVYDNTNHRYRYFDDSGKEIFLIKSFNEDGDEIGLSIEKNPTTESVEVIINNNMIGFVLNSTIYNLDMIEIGKLFGGRYSQKNINDFWEGIDYSRGNISIYDHTGIYKIGSLHYTPFIDHYAVLGIDEIKDVENMDARTLKKTIRNMQRLYKRLMREYNVKRNPNDKEIQAKATEITSSYLEIMSDLGFSDEKEKKILGFLPVDHFDEEKRSKWSDTEGYVPAIKRDIKGHQPDSQIQKDELYYSNE
tara:strand:+ start:557 stop:1429 length:873 start_codon:yes stop_codon:yes gene_type:complete